MEQRRKLAGAVVVAVALVVGLSGCALPLVMAGGAGGQHRGECGGQGVEVDVERVPDRVGVWQGEQVVNAAVIVNAGVVAGVGLRDQQIAVMTAMQESSLRNLGDGDWETSGATNPDGSATSSLGLFQQQEWWGSREERLDPSQAAGLFYGALLRVENRDQMPPWEVAHRVQRNQSAADYEDDWEGATQIVAALMGGYGGGVVSGGSGWTAPLGVPYTLTSGFGHRDLSVEGWQDVSEHNGQDFAAATGSPVLAVGAGTVVRVWDDGQVWGGRQVMVAHGDHVVSWYAHLSVQQVSVGQRVSVGQQVGEVGATGYATGPHLHLTIQYDGVAMDPVPFLYERGVVLDGTPGTATPVMPCQ